MLTEQDLIALSTMMDNKLQVQKQGILTQMVEVMSEQTEVLAKMVNDSETRINIKIENEVTKEIHSLFDGYKLTHEKQWELECKMKRIESELDRISNALTIAGLAG